MKKSDETVRGISRKYYGTTSFEGMLLCLLLLYSPDFPNAKRKMLYWDR